jgi:hypothetical protein
MISTARTILLLILALGTLVFILAFNKIRQAVDEGAELSHDPGTSISRDAIPVATSSPQTRVASNQPGNPPIQGEQPQRPSIPGWRVYKDENYNFQVAFPERGGIDDIGAIGDVLWPSDTPRKTMSFITSKESEDVSTIFSIGVYDKPSAVSVPQWIAEAYRQKQLLSEIEGAANGNIDTALASGTLGKRGIP